jgi:phosphatidylglycerophosphate synthase
LELVISIINSYSKLKGYEPSSSITGKVKTVILDTSIALCYLDFIVRVPKVILGITSILTNLMQIVSIWGYHKSYRAQVAQIDVKQ